MADFTSIAAVCSSIRRYIELCFTETRPIADRNTHVVTIRTEDFNTDASNVITLPALSIFLYRVDADKTMRAAWSSVAHRDGRAHTPLDMHLLLTAWAENADHEYRIMGRAVQCIEDNPILAGPLLDPLTDWAAYEAVQLCLENLSTEDIMRIFDSLPVDFKLSVPYVARVVVVDGQVSRPHPVVGESVSGIRAGVKS